MFPWLVVAVAGVAAHVLYFIKGEHHLEGPRLVGLIWIVPVLDSLAQIWTCHIPPVDAAGTSLVVTGIFLSSIYASIVTYRLFFHRLKAFPGPPLARVSKLWHFSKVVTSPQTHKLLDKLYYEYGDFVRTGPNELSIFKPEAFTTVHSSGSRCSKSIWYDALLPLRAVNTVRTKSEHTKRRRLWDKAFTPAALSSYNQRVAGHAKKLSQRIGTLNGRLEDTSFWFRCFAFDTLGDVSFGMKFDMLDEAQTNETEKSREMIETVTQGVSLIGPLSPIPWLLSILRALPGATQKWDKMLAFIWDKLQDRLQMEAPEVDIMSWMLDASAQSDSVHEDLPYLHGDAAVLLIAGSETVSSTLTFVFYHLASNPVHCKRLREEIKTPLESLSSKDLQNLPYLNAIINEAFRLYPPNPSTVPRVTPADGISVADRHIPGDVTVILPSYTINRLESCYHQAQKFLPERWCSKPWMTKDDSAFAPFGRGMYSCAGKSLALAELRMVIATLVMDFDIALGPSEDGLKVRDSARDNFVLWPGNLQLQFTQRSRLRTSTT
ncbi:MAG: hypothetical protein M1828_004464 [Chrysothrix sp. TS-e1954]|nr:MAG: hypothetical protein M1828_004464 [Chrysothrix sp. TS-e1954]